MLDVKRFHRTRLLQPDIWKQDEKVRPEFFDLYMMFLRNRVWLQLKRGEEYCEADEEHISSLFESLIVNKLEDTCTGFWTVDFHEDNNQKEEEDTLSIYIMFEHEEDLLRFLKTDGMMFRLAA